MSNRNKHQKRCTEKKEVTTMEQVTKDHQRLQEEMVQLKQYIAKLETQNQNNEYCHQYMNTNNHVNVFGQESLAHIDNEFISNCVNAREQGLVDMIKRVYFDVTVPANKTWKCKSMKDRILYAYEGGKWVEHDASWVLDMVIKKCCNIIMNYFLLNMNEFQDHSIHGFFKGIQDKKGNIYHSVKREAFAMLYHFDKNRHESSNEAFFQSLLESYLGGGHKQLECGITDITTEDFHAEIKKSHMWKDAVGQLLVYNTFDPRPEKRLYLFGNLGSKTLKNVQSTCALHGIKPFWLVHKDNKVTVHDIHTNPIQEIHHIHVK